MWFFVLVCCCFLLNSGLIYNGSELKLIFFFILFLCILKYSKLFILKCLFLYGEFKKKKDKEKRQKNDLPMHRINWTLGFLYNSKSKRKSAKEIWPLHPGIWLESLTICVNLSKSYILIETLHDNKSSSKT